MSIIEDLKQKQYHISASVKNTYCSSCLMHLERQQSWYAIHHTRKSVTLLCGGCRDKTEKSLPEGNDAIQIIEIIDDLDKPEEVLEENGHRY